MGLDESLAFSKLATISALFFYIFIIITLLSSNIRNKVVKVLTIPTPSTNVQIASLDTIRGLAAALIATAHIWNFATPIFDKTQQIWWQSLALGAKAVPIFAVLSGFLIYRSVKNIKTLDDMSRYIKRRFLRIYPVYVFCILLGFIVGQHGFDLANFLSNLFLIRTITSEYLTIVVPPTWSVYVEILFYITLPIWFVAFKNRVLLASFITICVLIFVDPLGKRELWLWKYFFMGVFASELSFRLDNKISERSAIVVFLIGAILLYFDFQVWKNIKFDWFNSLNLVPKNLAEYSVGLGLACMFILVGSVQSIRIAKWMSITPLRILGCISYSLYLTHPFFILAVFPKLQFALFGKGAQNLIEPIVSAPAWYLPFVMFPGCLLWALFCYILIERPFLLLRPGHKVHTQVSVDKNLDKSLGYGVSNA